MRRLSACLLLVAAGLSACATDGAAPAPPAALAQAGPCAGDGFGCASATNLRLMVADPADLEHGAEPAAPMGDGALGAVRRHRAGEAKPLPADISTEAN